MTDIDLGTFPHCDSSVLHAPKWALDLGALLSQDGRRWTLCIHRIDEAPWRAENVHTSRGGLAPPVTPPFAIPLTQPAWNALLSGATTTASSGSNQRPNRVNVEGVDINIVRGGARNAWLNGGGRTRTRRSDAQNSLNANGSELRSAAGSSGRRALNPALTVKPVFLGTSWSLTIETDEGSVTKLSPSSLAKETWPESLPSWLSAISSVLTAIASELTPERWQQESERLSRGECEYCDRHPEWQALRRAWGIAFTGHEPVERHPGWREVPCPSDQRRGTGQAHVWGGNRPTNVDVPQLESSESVAHYSRLNQTLRRRLQKIAERTRRDPLWQKADDEP